MKKIFNLMKIIISTSNSIFMKKDILSHLFTLPSRPSMGQIKLWLISCESKHPYSSNAFPSRLLPSRTGKSTATLLLLQKSKEENPKSERENAKVRRRRGERTVTPESRCPSRQTSATPPSTFTGNTTGTAARRPPTENSSAVGAVGPVAKVRMRWDDELEFK